MRKKSKFWSKYCCKKRDMEILYEFTKLGKIIMTNLLPVLLTMSPKPKRDCLLTSFTNSQKCCFHILPSLYLNSNAIKLCGPYCFNVYDFPTFGAYDSHSDIVRTHLSWCRQFYYGCMHHLFHKRYKNNIVFQSKANHPQTGFTVVLRRQ